MANGSVEENFQFSLETTDLDEDIEMTDELLDLNYNSLKLKFNNSLAVLILTQVDTFLPFFIPLQMEEIIFMKRSKKYSSI